MVDLIIGRDKEKHILGTIWASKEAEFVAVYGRRRVGKTFLIREYFATKGKFFELTGMKDGSLKEQLANFASAFSACFYPGILIQAPKSWKEALEQLTKEIIRLPENQKITVFLDELPWLASKRSRLLQNLDYFWNTRWSRMPQLKLLVCGSAASWMIDNLINAKGGLHNRLTKTILLEPFNLTDAKQFLFKRGVVLNNKQILDIYMAMGGVPYYLKQIEKSKSAVQNIQDICFKKGGLLYDEFPRLFRSLFQAADVHLKIFEEIAACREGISREQLLKKVGLKTGGTFNQRMRELEAAGFVTRFIPYGKQKKHHYYRVVDEYSNFYLHWIAPVTVSNQRTSDSNYWQSKSQTPAFLAWAGYAFEGICFKHINLIKNALRLEPIACEIGNFRVVSKKGQIFTGAQIDLLFDRADGAISLCEIKYSDKEFVIDKSYAKELANKLEVFEQTTKTKKQLFLVLLTTYGIKKNLWSEDLIAEDVCFLELF